MDSKIQLITNLNEFPRVRKSRILKGLCTFCVVLTVLPIFLVLNSFQKSHQNIIRIEKDYGIQPQTQPPCTDLVCQRHARIDSALEILESRNISRQAIFFIETSGRGTLLPRQLCALESAARHNPDADIYGLLLDLPADPRLTRDEQVLTLLRYYGNVRLLWAKSATYFVGTPLQEWNIANRINTSVNRAEDASDIMRVVTVLKYGGIYLDLDFVIQQSLTSMPPNWLTFELGSNPTSSAFGFQKGHPMVNIMANEQAATFDGSIFGYSGPSMVARVMSRTCGMSLSELFNTGKNCTDIVVLKPDKFYPISYPAWRLLFDESVAGQTMETVRSSLGVHMFNYLSHGANVTLGSNQAYSQLAQKHCPRAYWSCFKNF
ncbi:lactosylceramide 4-alpha-galactosyltransferase-like [Cloeon dipterum]|uniref:lactosylceramide 4-alpha-galactosyltransferase-like n=1 Tax=Cloeon dipterum TaxID=197152 RepID=UPI0032204FBE